MAREPIAIVQLDQDFCSRTHGTAPCTATGEPCFNTRATCQDPANYALGAPLALKFVKNRSPQMRDDNYFPFLESVRITPAKLNPGGASSGMSSLGMRATLSVTFSDHNHSDFLVDPYRADRSYDPIERSTFWAKWRARNLYYMHRPISLISGYYSGGAIVDAVTRRFVITGFSGPDSDGTVTISAKDVLTLAEGGKAQAPAQSSGELSAPITNVAGSATLAPAGIGNLEYPAAGYVRIEKEIAAFTRSADVLTLTTRGAYGTTPAAHDAGANVQLCLQYTSESPHDILEDLLVNYAGIPADYLDLAQWEQEAITDGFLPYLYSALISSPESVSKLIGELCEQMYFAIWYDERDAKVKIRALRFAQGEEITDLTDAGHLLKDSIAWADRPDEQVTQVWVYYSLINPTEKIDEEKNYAAAEIVADLDAESVERYNTKRIRKIYSRWIGGGNAAAAVELAQTLHHRFGNVPRAVSFSLDAKDRAIWLGDFVRLHNRLNVDKFGQVLPASVQIYQAEEAETGTKYNYVAQEFIPAASPDSGADGVQVIIAADILNVNLRALYDSTIGVTPESGDVINFIVRQGVTVGGDATGGGTNVLLGSRITTNDFYDAGASAITTRDIDTVPALQRASIGSYREIAASAAYEALGTVDYIVREYPASVALKTGTWPAGVQLNLLIESGAAILGESGVGSYHALKEPLQSGQTVRKTIPGGDGGHALLIEHAVEITNLGTISGGGGGAGSQYISNPYTSTSWLFPGGAGAGSLPKPPGDIKFLTTAPGPGTWTNPTAATLLVPGFSGAYRTRVEVVGDSGQIVPGTMYRNERDTGTLSGGQLANNGANGAAFWKYSTGYSFQIIYGNGGAAGYAIKDGKELITWAVKGDVRGAEL